MTDPTPLSPAAQAVLDAATDTWLDVFLDDHIPAQVAAAALRAAALYCKRDRVQLVSLADELEGNLLESPDSSDGPAVSDDREPASVEDNLALRVQRLEAMRETEKAALLDAFKQIDKLQGRLDFQYTKLCRLEEAAEDG